MTVPDITPRQSATLCVIAAVIGAAVGLAIAGRIKRREAVRGSEQWWG